MRRGEVWWAELPAPAGRRPVLLLSRDEAYLVRELVTVAPLTTRVRQIPSEVPLGPGDGVPKTCVVNLDTVTTIPRRTLGGVGGPVRGPPILKGRGVLETADELAGLGGEGAALGGRDRLARDELLAERVDEVAVLRDAIVEMRAGGQPRRAHVADHL